VRWILAFAPLVLAACLPGVSPVLEIVNASPPSRSPEVRDPHNRLDVRYRLNSAAEISTQIQAGDGQAWTIHALANRPTPGEYVFQFDGTVPGPGRNERRVLASGDYRIVLDVTGRGQRQQVSVPLPIRDADVQPPDVTDLATIPERISPDFDARDDITHVTFRLAKEARLALFLDRELADGQIDRVWLGEETRAQAGEQRLVWNGLASGQPVPSGMYLLGVRARDTVGNIVERSRPLVVQDAGMPEASIVAARIGPRQIIRGDRVCIDALVRNTGGTVLRTNGPDPGYVYDSMESYSSIEGHRFAEHAGYWRVGLNWSGSTDTASATYPYRWGFGRDLQPGEEVTVNGCVIVQQERDNIVFFAGLVQEGIAIHNAGAGLVRVDISS
jgi:hypothetical protein